MLPQVDAEAAELIAEFAAGDSCVCDNQPPARLRRSVEQSMEPEWNLCERLLAELPTDEPVRACLVGSAWTLVKSGVRATTL